MMVPLPADPDPHLDLDPDPPLAVARRVAAILATDPAVVAVAMGGSRATLGLGADPGSDVDLEVYTRGDVTLDTRRAAIDATNPIRTEAGSGWWGLADEWITAEGIHLDAAFFEVAWMEDRLGAVLDRHEPSLGYTTCFWHTIRSCRPLEDREGWLTDLRVRAAVPYPEVLRRRIVEHNHPVLRAALPAYATQLANAARRGDLISINHRLAGLLASYSDILFAVNRQTHPGEKRLVAALIDRCDRLPDHMADDLADLLRTALTDLPGLPPRVDRLLDRLDALLRTEGFDPTNLPSLASHT
jgi:hypothetical protein